MPQLATPFVSRALFPGDSSRMMKRRFRPGTYWLIGRRIIEASGRLSSAAELGIELVNIRLPIGGESQEFSIVTQELTNKGAGRGPITAAKTGGGTAFGAVIGALAGVGTGAGVGVASGGALGLGANALTHAKEIDDLARSSLDGPWPEVT